MDIEEKINPQPSNDDNGKGIESDELLRLKAEKMRHDLGFEDMAAFKKGVEKLKQDNETLEKERVKLELDKTNLATEKTNFAMEKTQLATDIARNKNVKAVLESKVYTFHKETEMVNDALKKRLEHLDSIAEKIYEARTGRDVMGLRDIIINGHKKSRDESVVMDVNYREELIDLIEPVLVSIGHKPLFDEDGHYIPITNREGYLTQLSNKYQNNGDGDGEDVNGESEVSDMA